MVTITPEQLARSGSEDGEQLAIMQWAALNLSTYPDLKWLAHVPNGGFRNLREAAKLKAMGVRPGFPDLNLLVKRGRYSGLFIELKISSRKTQKNGGLEDEQINWIKFLNEQGFCACACYGWVEAVNVIKLYLNGTKQEKE